MKEPGDPCDGKRCGHHGGSGNTAGPPSQDQSQDLSLDLASVRDGSDRRTSLMVRNIPNKYTQSMLLTEFAGLGHGPTKMDFFYLPIDFKNRCNFGYGFVNFRNAQALASGLNYL